VTRFILQGGIRGLADASNEYLDVSTGSAVLHLTEPLHLDAKSVFGRSGASCPDAKFLAIGIL
jgi:hypothetical protein